MLTLPEVQEALPSHLRAAATQSLVDKVNAAHGDPVLAGQIRDNFMSYTKVLMEGKFKIEDYLRAVVYVSFKLMGFNNQESYTRTFPKRYQDLVAKGATDKDISSYVSAYAKGKLVNLILEQTMIPSWVLNQDLYQKAINVQADLMVSAKSELVRTQAANSLITALKKPDKAQVELSVTAPDSNAVSDLNNMLTRMAEAYQGMIQGGMRTQTIAHQPLHPKSGMRDVTPQGEPQ